MKLGISTLLFRDQPLDKVLLQSLQESGIESIKLTDCHTKIDHDWLDRETYDPNDNSVIDW